MAGEGDYQSSGPHRHSDSTLMDARPGDWLDICEALAATWLSERNLDSEAGLRLRM